MKLKYVCFLVAVALSAAGSSVAQNPSQRPFKPEDRQKLETLGRTRISPDGQLLAYFLRRSLASGISASRNALRNYQRSEVWVVPVAGGDAKKIAGGGSDGIGFWNMTWSPDSQRLALESADPDGQVGLWVWERTNGKLRRLIERGVADELPQWTDEHRLLYTLPPAGSPVSINAGGFKGAIDQAEKAWAKGLGGREPSVSVLESGIPQAQPQGSLAVIDVQNGEQHSVLTGNCVGALISPGGRYVACPRQLDITQVATSGAFRVGPTFLLGLSVATLEGKVLFATDGIKDLVPRSLRWSPDGSLLAVVGRIRQGVDAPLQVFVYHPDTQTLVPMNTHGIVPVADYYSRRPQLLWTSRNELLVGAQPESSSATRADLWALSEKEQPRNITREMKSVPSTLLTEHGGESFLGIAQGKLWRLHPDGSTSQDLSAQLDARLTSIFWPYFGLSEPQDYSTDLTTIVVSAQRTSLANDRGETRNAIPGEKVETDLFSIDLASGKFTRLKMPSAAATFLNFSPKLNTAVFSLNDRSGTYLWLSNAMSDARLILQTNTFVREIDESQWKKIDYRGLDGQNLTGWLLLPFGYREDKRYPLIAVVYAGIVYGSAPPPYQSINDTLGDGEGALLAAHGYAVLFPSMPRLADGVVHDNYMDLTKGVLPALDKVIDLGIADPHRVGVIGQSYGGYSVYGLITQTKRFQAAVALAGPANLVSYYGQFSGGSRYDSFPQAGTMTQQNWAEGGQGALGTPPWKDVERYIRNSPIFYADHVETPVLIIQGDMDFVPIEQGEEFFMAMNRQGKRARFLRYWTGGHGTGGANAIDMWKQIYAWFDEFLMKPEKTESSKQ